VGGGLEPSSLIKVNAYDQLHMYEVDSWLWFSTVNQLLGNVKQHNSFDYDASVDSTKASKNKKNTGSSSKIRQIIHNNPP